MQFDTRGFKALDGWHECYWLGIAHKDAIQKFEFKLESSNWITLSDSRELMSCMSSDGGLNRTTTGSAATGCLGTIEHEYLLIFNLQTDLVNSTESLAAKL